ncbi:HD domain-containing protein [Paenibacillus albicereus]|uniref:HD domain-containing protein n=1 Tax=Paenibacillus albicereus TaxID=2726185 RepID=A0A6H2H3H8_9BACL|nr:HD domain-containing phosphohydrolase [Paenibacillus albicereus]QJC53976.1 HD domain-containing protein [Paenibacillus albicereus]
MPIYKKFLYRLILNYLIGSSLAVVGVGGAIIALSLRLEPGQPAIVAIILLLSVVCMLICEGTAFRRHVAPVRELYRMAEPDAATARQAYFRVHRLPLLAVRRILGPHLFGFTLPALLLTLACRPLGWLDVPGGYLLIAALASALIASLHAMVEYFLTAQAIRPLLLDIQSFSKAGSEEISLRGKVIVPIPVKFQASIFVIGALPVMIFILSTQVRLSVRGESSLSYWAWSALMLLVTLGFASFAAWLLGKNVRQPIEELYTMMRLVRKGNLSVRVPDLYSDEFSRLVDGFNHMVQGLGERERMNEQLLQSYFSTLAAALDARDPYTAGHSQRVAAYALMIGRAEGMYGDQLDVLHKTALLHDIGKIGVRDSVLLKDGKLTEEEFAQIKVHTVMGENILRQVEPQEAMAAFLPGVRSHHERYDGKGYPDGLRGEEIPLMGRIIAVADAYDAMTSDRPYRKGMPTAQALAILEDGRGTQWDPRFARTFINAMGGMEQPGQVTLLPRRPDGAKAEAEPPQAAESERSKSS